MRLSLFLLSALMPLLLWGQGLDGSWKGTLQAGPLKLTLVIHIDAAGKKATLDVVEQGAKGLPLSVKALTDDSISVAFPQIGLTYSGNLSQQKLVGTFGQQGFKAPLTLERGAVELRRPQEPVGPLPYTTTELTFDGGDNGVTLAATLTYPVGHKPGQRVPVVVMVTGSGPQNRDEEMLTHKPFLVLADHLARHGIASLRYDDRGVGQSTGTFTGTTTDSFAADASKAVALMRAKDDFSAVGLLGHSEGGAIGYMLASAGEVDFLVSLAGPACRIDTLMMLQLNGLARAQGAPTDIAKTPQEACDLLLKQQNDAWMQAFLKADYTPYVAKTRCPVLALGGETDLNVPVSYNHKVLRAHLPANKCSLIKQYAGLSHTLHHNPTGNPLAMATIEETIAPEVMTDIVEWITTITKQ